MGSFLEMTEPALEWGFANQRTKVWRFFIPAYAFALLLIVGVVVDLIALQVPSFRGEASSVELAYTPAVSLIAFLGFMAWGQRQAWGFTPDRVRFETDRIVAGFEPHLFVRTSREVKSMPYDQITTTQPDRGALTPRTIYTVVTLRAAGLAEPRRPTFDTWEATQPPDDQPGFASRLDLNLDNFARFERHASASKAGAPPPTA